MLKTGEQYRESLRDDREVFINGERVKSVPEHPAFKPIVDVRSRIYDMAHEDKFKATMAYEKDGETFATSWQPPHTQDDWWAKKAWVEFHDEVESLSFDGQKYSPVKGFAAKSAEHALRLAGILTLVENFKALEIPLKHMYAGIKLSQFYLGEALRLFGAASINQDLVLAENALEWAKPKGDRFSLVDLYQIGPNAIRDKATAKRITQILIDHHWIREVAGGAVINGVKRQAVFEIRP